MVFAFVLWALVEANGPAYDNLQRRAWLETATTTAAVLVGIVGVVASLLWAANRAFTTEAASAQSHVEAVDVPNFNITGNGAQIYLQPRDSPAKSGQFGTAALLEPDPQVSMLTQIYAHGLAQAKVSFFVSIVFGMVGSAVLLTGVALAIMHADSDGSRYGAIVTQTAGAVINLLAGVFFLQSNRTRRDMGAQGVMLRDDSRFDRSLKAAGVLSDNITDGALRNQVRAQMALQLVGGQFDATPAPEPDEMDGSCPEPPSGDAAAWPPHAGS
ncbi:hypothetical protein [Streptomyces sp. NPDC048111]|uniref:TRADD-N-associated membrane domain-containing protein n=1 Tax=Streptomyces sp. NPDC048111 TaxID=3365500 RepID=UPI003711CF95